MSYKLINANEINFNSDGYVTQNNILKMPCIYADLPNGVDGGHYDIESYEKLMRLLENVYKCPSLVLDKSDALDEIMQLYKEEFKMEKYKAESEVEDGNN